MNEVVIKAKEINTMAEKELKGMYIPDLEIGEECEINDIWDGEGNVEDVMNGSCSIKTTENGEDGEGNIPIWINYTYEILEEKNNCMDTIVRIKGIDIL